MRPHLAFPALAVVVGVLVSGCVSTSRQGARSVGASTSREQPDATRTNATTAATLRCPATTAPVDPQAGQQGAPLAADPEGALACLTNEPASKRAVIGPGTRLPASVAAALARLIDQAAPATVAAAERCAPSAPSLLTRFGYPSGPVDVVESIGCPAGAVAYVHDRGYVLPAFLAQYLQDATDPAGSGLTPNVMGEPLTRAGDLAREAGDTVQLAGELIDTSPEGRVLLQYPTLDHQVGVIAAVHRSPRCRAGQLAVQDLPGGAGSGSDFGTILLRNTSASWCELDGPVTVAGLTAGHPVTDTLAVTVPDGLELSPHAVAVVPGQALPADQLAASVRLSAGYRDGEDGSLCNPHWIIPSTWGLVLGSDTLTVANGRATAKARSLGAGGLITCRGRFAAAPMRVATS